VNDENGLSMDFMVIAGGIDWSGVVVPDGKNGYRRGQKMDDDFNSYLVFQCSRVDVG
jgi:hypothetical protein